jgi:hypothetical protein
MCDLELSVTTGPEVGDDEYDHDSFRSHEATGGSNNANSRMERATKKDHQRKGRFTKDSKEIETE